MQQENQPVTITEEQKARLPDYAKLYTEYGLKPHSESDEEIESAINEVYSAYGKEAPKLVIIVNTPYQALDEVAKIYRDVVDQKVDWQEDKFEAGKALMETAKKNLPAGSSEEEIKTRACKDFAQAQLDHFHFGAQTLFLGYHKFMQDVVGYQFKQVEFDRYHDASLKLFWYLPYNKICVVCRKPVKINVNPAGQLHNTEGPSVEFLSPEYNLYHVTSIKVDKDLVENRHKITPEEIEAEQNQEMRRVKMTLFGFDRYMQSGNPEVLDEQKVVVFGQDGTAQEFTEQLLRKEVPDDETLMMINVVNRTAEPDGTFKRYLLMVDPQLRCLNEQGEPVGEPQELTVRNAVASTFGMRGDQYSPDQQS